MEDQTGASNVPATLAMPPPRMTLGGRYHSLYWDFNDRDFLVYACRDLTTYHSLCEMLLDVLKDYDSDGAIEWLLYNNEYRWSLSIFLSFCDDRFLTIRNYAGGAAQFMDVDESTLNFVLKCCPEIGYLLNFSARELPVVLGNQYKIFGCYRHPDKNWAPVPIGHAIQQGLIEPLTNDERSMLITNTGSPLVEKLRSLKIIGPEVGLRERPAEEACPFYNDKNFVRPAAFPTLPNLTCTVNEYDLNLELLKAMAVSLVVRGCFDGLGSTRPQNIPGLQDVITSGIIRSLQVFNPGVPLRDLLSGWNSF